MWPNSLESADTMLASCLKFLRRNALRIGVVLGTFALVASFIFVQQMREAFAEQDYQSARTQVLKAQARAAQLGLDTAEYSDLQRQELTTAAEVPPSVTAPFNEQRIAFFSRAATQEADIKEQLETRMQKLLAETHDAAQAATRQLSLNMGKARQLGVDEQLLDEFTGLPVKAQDDANNATTVRAFRAVNSELKAPLSKLSLIVADQQTAMTKSRPEKAITLSLKEQVIRAYSHSHQVFWTYVTTGRPGLETDAGSFKVYWKVSPWTMHSPWPKGSPYWYPDSKVQMVMWFNGGDGIHDASWRSRYGPGTNGPHYDPTGEDTGTHGCVNVPWSNMVWLWNWTPTGTPVIVY